VILVELLEQVKVSCHGDDVAEYLSHFSAEVDTAAYKACCCVAIVSQSELPDRLLPHSSTVCME